MASQDVDGKNTMAIADWSSEIMHRSNTSEPKACFTFDMKLHSYISSISAKLIYQNTRSPDEIETRSLLQHTVDEWDAAENSQVVKELKNSFSIALSGIKQYQVRTIPLSKQCS